MSKIERYSSIVGAVLLAFAAYVVAGDKKRMAERQAQPAAAPVEELGERLKEAWSEHHHA